MSACLSSPCSHTVAFSLSGFLDSEECKAASDDPSGGDPDSQPDLSQKLKGMGIGLALLLVVFGRKAKLSDASFTWFLLFLRVFHTKSPIDFFEHMGFSRKVLTKLVDTYLHTQFTEYIVCVKCKKIRTQEQVRVLFDEQNNREESVVCDCKWHEPLLERKEEKWKPRSVYYYQSIKYRLKQMYKRKNWLKLIDHWRNRPVSEIMSDVYDGDVWHELRQPGELLYERGNVVLILNHDNFNPFNIKDYSMGAIYATIPNLPREERYKKENLILIGLIPGPKEVQGDINSFLSPLIAELRELERGISVEMPNGDERLVRCCILAFCCDVPGLRKLLQWGSHASNMGCHLCLKRVLLLLEEVLGEEEKEEEKKCDEVDENESDLSDSDTDVDRDENEEESEKREEENKKKKKKPKRSWAGTESYEERTDIESRKQAK